MDVRRNIPSQATNDIKNLMKSYRQAQADLREKKLAYDEAARRVKLMRKDIEAGIEQNGFDVYRAIYAHDTNGGGQTIRLRRVASGINTSLAALLDPVLSSSADTGDTGPHGGDETAECTTACDEAMQEYDTQNIACICDCLDLGEAGPMTAVTCISEEGSFPEPD